MDSELMDNESLPLLDVNLSKTNECSDPFGIS
jgi:hypothetical protein